MKKFWNIFNDYAEYEVEYDDARIDGEKVSVRTITMRITPDKTADALYDIYDYITDSDDISKFIKKYDDYLKFMLGDSFDDEKYDSVYDMFQTIMDEAEESLDKTCNRLESYAKQYEDEDENPYDSTLIIKTPKGKSTLIDLTLKTSFAPDIYIRTNCKDGIKESNEFSIKVGSYSVEYNVLWDNEYYYQAKLIIKSTNTKTPFNYVIDIDIDKELGTYTVALVTETTGQELLPVGRYYYYYDYTQTNRISLIGTYSQKKNELAISFDKIEVKIKRDYKDRDINDTTGTEEIKIDGKIIIKENDKMPSPMKDYNNISDITEKQLKNLLKPLN